MVGGRAWFRPHAEHPGGGAGRPCSEAVLPGCEAAGDVVTEALVLDCGIITVSDGPASDSPSIPMQ